MVESRCGLICSECSYKEPWLVVSEANCSPRHPGKCGGCIETKGHPFHGECPVAVCCQNKGYDHCGQCEELPCKQLYYYSFIDKEHGDNPPGARIEQCRKWAKEGEYI